MIDILKRNGPDSKTVYFFGKATQGNWRNSLYVEGGCETCVKQGPGCSDLLFALSSDGAPVLISAKTAADLSWESIDKTECAGSMTFQTLMKLLEQWIIMNIDSAQACPLDFFSEYCSKIERRQMPAKEREDYM